jgi:hypothetical protein
LNILVIDISGLAGLVVKYLPFLFALFYFSVLFLTYFDKFDIVLLPILIDRRGFDSECLGIVFLVVHLERNAKPIFCPLLILGMEPWPSSGSPAG